MLTLSHQESHRITNTRHRHMQRQTPGARIVNLCPSTRLDVVQGTAAVLVSFQVNTCDIQQASVYKKDNRVSLSKTSGINHGFNKQFSVVVLHTSALCVPCQKCGMPKLAMQLASRFEVEGTADVRHSS